MQINRSSAILALKIAASIVLVSIIAVSADWRAVGSTLRNADPRLLMLVFVLMVACVVYSAYKWWLLLRLHGAPFSLLSLSRWYFIAMLFNNFLPTSIGGDGFRVYRTLDNNRAKSTALVAVFVERLSGILTLLALGWVAAIVHALLTHHPLSLFIAYSGGVIFCIGVVALALGVYFDIYTRIHNWPKLPDKLKNVIAHYDDYRANPAAGLWAVGGVSIIFHLISIGWMLLLANAIGADMSLLQMAIVAALVSAVTVLPLSINGIGLVDGSFIFLAGQYGMDHAHGLGFMLLQRFFLIPISLIGLAFYWRDTRPCAE